MHAGRRAGPGTTAAARRKRIAATDHRSMLALLAERSV